MQKTFLIAVCIAVFAPFTVSAYGGGGGIWAGAGVISAPSAFAPVAPTIAPQVLGVESFRFTTNLSIGTENEDVRELQERLQSEGVFTHDEITGYFGPITRDAVAAYQRKHNIEPASGYVGPLTRTHLNRVVTQVAAVGSSLTEVQRANIQRQIDALLGIVDSLLARVAALSQSQ